MGFQDKIDEIRKKPEHIRMRYVWGWVAFSMVIVVTIWIISLTVQSQKLRKLEGEKDQEVFFEQFSSQKKSIEETGREMKDVLGRNEAE